MQYIEQFLEMTLAERGIAENSLISYRRDLLDYREFLSKNKIAELSAISEDIEKYIAALVGQQISPRSIS